MVKIASEHINAQLNGWRTADGIILREPITASFAYTPALAKYDPLICSPHPLLQLSQLIGYMNTAGSLTFHCC